MQQKNGVEEDCFARNQQNLKVKKKCNRAMEAEMLELAFLSLTGMAFLNTNSCQTLNSLYPGMNVLIKSYLISLAPWNSA